MEILSLSFLLFKSTTSKQCFPGGSDSKESPCNVRDSGSIPGLGRSLGEGNGNPVQPGKSHVQSSLAGYSPCGRKESGMTE